MMKLRTIIGKTVLVMALFACIGCSGDNDVSINDYGNAPVVEEDTLEVVGYSQIVGITWKLCGFGTVGENEAQKPEPQEGNIHWRERQYTVRFTNISKEGMESYYYLECYSSTNELVGYYTVKDNMITIGILGGTKVGEVYDGDKYCEALCHTSLFGMRNGQLIVFYNNQQNYLVFDKYAN